MSNTQPRRRGAGRDRLDAPLSVAVTADLRARLNAGAERYGVSVSSLARLAIEAGLRTALARVRAEARREAG